MFALQADHATKKVDSFADTRSLAVDAITSVMQSTEQHLLPLVKKSTLQAKLGFDKAVSADNVIQTFWI